MTTNDDPIQGQNGDGVASYATLVGARARHLRTRRGMALTEVSRRARETGVDISIDALSKIETGARVNVSVDELMTLTKVFGREPIWFLSDAPVCDNCQDDAPEGFECVKCYRRWAGSPSPF